MTTASPFMKTATTARLALLTALQEICKGYLAATTNADRAALMLALDHTQKALIALE
jgi:hypothetical protein